MVIYKFHKHPPSFEGTCLFGIPSVTSVKLLPFSFAAINVKCCGFLNCSLPQLLPSPCLISVVLQKGASSGRGRRFPRGEFRSSAWRQNHLKRSWSFTVFCYRTLKSYLKNIWIPGISRTINDKIIKPQDAWILVSRRSNKEVEPTVPQILLCFLWQAHL